ncbi:hypothetical protein NDU88_003819 [Pleurodeles waltl]|uniref:Uncharacterized protein n=1 Tax=Pleurodeles waltl TaxID=8319 RepID=A0AAV7LGK5_PLEWA|nr:hypothetical protein NDU88_003819 [Pleurodeles waltl]
MTTHLFDSLLPPPVFVKAFILGNCTHLCSRVCNNEDHTGLCSRMWYNEDCTHAIAAAGIIPAAMVAADEAVGGSTAGAVRHVKTTTKHPSQNRSRRKGWAVVSDSMPLE